MIRGRCDVRQGNNCPGKLSDYDGIHLIMAGGHGHAPTCLSIDLYNNDTGDLICRTEARYGTSNQARVIGVIGVSHSNCTLKNIRCQVENLLLLQTDLVLLIHLLGV